MGRFCLRLIFPQRKMNTSLTGYMIWILYVFTVWYPDCTYFCCLKRMAIGNSVKAVVKAAFLPTGLLSMVYTFIHLVKAVIVNISGYTLQRFCGLLNANTKFQIQANNLGFDIALSHMSEIPQLLYLTRNEKLLWSLWELLTICWGLVYFTGIRLSPSVSTAN